jgi:alcohol dehydrogenase
MMQGVQLTGHGGPEVLVWSDTLPVPTPKPGEALVRVLAAGVNNTDINTRIGWYAKSVTGATDASGGAATEDGGWAGALAFPRIQGADLCGRIVAHGPGVSAPPLGARVTCATNQAVPTPENPVAFEAIGSEYDGAFAEYCAVPADRLHDVSVSPLSDTEIGAMPCAFGTAMALLRRAGVTAADTVLVTGASGGVGLAAVQIAARMGAHVIGQTSPDKAEAVRAAGAVNTVGRGETPGARSVDVVIDLVGGPQWGHVLDALKPGGRYAVSGAIAGPIVSADLRTIYLNDLTLFGVTFQPPEGFAALVEMINAGTLRPLVSQTYPLRDIHRAQEDFATKRHPGKLVLIP